MITATPAVRSAPARPSVKAVSQNWAETASYWVKTERLSRKETSSAGMWPPERTSRPYWTGWQVANRSMRSIYVLYGVRRDDPAPSSTLTSSDHEIHALIRNRKMPALLPATTWNVSPSLLRRNHAGESSRGTVCTNSYDAARVGGMARPVGGDLAPCSSGQRCRPKKVGFRDRHQALGGIIRSSSASRAAPHALTRSGLAGYCE